MNNTAIVNRKAILSIKRRSLYRNKLFISIIKKNRKVNSYTNSNGFSLTAFGSSTDRILNRNK